jgi:creatinine amidohydrolase
MNYARQRTMKNKISISVRKRGHSRQKLGQAPKASAAVFWDRLTWEEIQSLGASGMNMCLLPVGATEQHGPHLGVGMDTCNAAALCAAVSAETGVPVLPPLNYGCSLGHSRRWPGTVALQPQTLISLITEMFDWLHSARFPRLLMVNGHVGNFAPLRCALEIIRSRWDDAMVGICNVADISPEIRAKFYADAADWHANAAETALMLALAPEMVREKKIISADDPDRTAGLVFAHPVNRTSKNGVTGFPSRATREQGEKLFNKMVAELSSKVRCALNEKFPLEQSYHFQ